MQWFEDLPKQCPPSDAIEPNNKTFYRIVDTGSLTSLDFASQRKLSGPDKQFKGIPECIARSVSLFTEYKHALKNCKLPKFKNSKIIGIKLKETDGLVKKTFRHSHHSWWRSKSFNYKNIEIVESE